MAQLMPLPLTVSCFSKIQIGFTFLVPTYLGSPGQRAVKLMCVCVQEQVSLPASLVHSACELVAALTTQLTVSTAAAHNDQVPHLSVTHSSVVQYTPTPATTTPGQSTASTAASASPSTLNMSPR